MTPPRALQASRVQVVSEPPPGGLAQILPMWARVPGLTFNPLLLAELQVKDVKFIKHLTISHEIQCAHR